MSAHTARGHWPGDVMLMYTYAIMCFLFPAARQSVLGLGVHACIFSWHNWDIRVTLMHHIYLLFITGRKCSDWPAHISVTIVFTAIVPVYLEIPRWCFSLSSFHLSRDKKCERCSFCDFQTFRLLHAVCSRIRIENGGEIARLKSKM